MRITATTLLTFFLTAAIMIWPTTNIQAQINKEDPFFNNYKLGANNEIITMSGGDTTTVFSVVDALGDVATDGIELAFTNTIGAPWGMVTNNEDAVGDMVTGDFDGDGLDEFVAAWAGADGTVVLYYTDVDPSDFSFLNTEPIFVQDLGFPNRYEISDFFVASIIRLEIAQLDTDPAPEFILSYWADDNSVGSGPIQILAFDTNGGNDPELISAISDQRLSPDITDAEENLRRSSKYELHAGDFDGDETDELAMIHITPDDPASDRIGWSMVGTVYDLVNGALLQTGESPAPFFGYTGNANEFVERMAADAGDYNGDGRDEVAMVWGRGQTNASAMYYAVYSFSVSSDLTSIELVGNDFLNSTMGDDGYPMSMTTYDINLDGSDEMIFEYRYNLDIQGLDQDLNFQDYGGASFLNWEKADKYTRTIAVTDVDVLENDELRIEVVNFDRSGIKVWQNRTDQQPGNTNDGIHIGPGTNDFTTSTFFGVRPMAIMTADFDGDAVYFGSPRRQRVTDIVQPLVILNAPPIHFDVFDENIFDVNECFVDDPRISCEHRAIYENASSQEFEVSTEVSVDWGVSAELEGEVSGGIGPVSGSVTAKLSAGYGEGFSRKEGVRRTVTVKVTSDAIDDDRVYATISNYDILEYPVYADGELQGYVAVAIPELQGIESLDNTWFGSKSGIAGDYITQHEVGNILSYPSEAQVPEGAGAFGNGGFEGGGGDTWELSSTSTQTWELRFSSESISQRTRSSYLSLGAEVSVEGKVDYGVASARAKATVSGEYNRSQLSTHTTTVRNESALMVEFGTIDGAILGSKTYTVSPFVYWGPGGALTLDYAVQPDVSSGVPSWWEQNYGGAPDLTMILPWRLDEEKGLASTNPELQSKETRDILFLPEKPETGDLVSIQARIQNFSLTDQLTPFTVEFYLGDPNTGGNLIQNINGISSIEVPGLASRESVIVELEDWIVPDGVGGNTFVFAVIDGEDHITEVHENNNVGWVLLNEELGTAVSNEKDAFNVPQSFTLSQNYPNPFNPTTSIQFELPVAGEISLKVYDLLGREVMNLADGRWSAGTHEVKINAGGLPTGFYMYRLHTSQGSLIRKMMLIK